VSYNLPIPFANRSAWHSVCENAVWRSFSDVV
jgi:hypothetical protein